MVTKYMAVNCRHVEWLYRLAKFAAYAVYQCVIHDVVTARPTAG